MFRLLDSSLLHWKLDVYDDKTISWKLHMRHMTLSCLLISLNFASYQYQLTNLILVYFLSFSSFNCLLVLLPVKVRRCKMEQFTSFLLFGRWRRKYFECGSKEIRISWGYPFGIWVTQGCRWLGTSFRVTGMDFSSYLRQIVCHLSSASSLMIWEKICYIANVLW